jgi:hypothetical protein
MRRNEPGLEPVLPARCSRAAAAAAADAAPAPSLAEVAHRRSVICTTAAPRTRMSGNSGQFCLSGILA